MPEGLTFQCAETDRMFGTAEEARASEIRFRELQAECDAGRIPALRKRDVIYVYSALHLTHGIDDFCGGLAEVIDVVSGKNAGNPTSFIRIAQEPDTQHNWPYLAPMQKGLREHFGKEWSHPNPDYRREFIEP